MINAEKIILTGKKETDKSYMSYSGWKGGEHYRTVREVRARHPERLIMHAVKGMLPKNRLGDRLFAFGARDQRCPERRRTMLPMTNSPTNNIA